MNITLHHDIALLAPLLVLCAGAFIILLIDVFRENRSDLGLASSFVLLIALCFSILTFSRTEPHQTVFAGMMYADPFGLFFSSLLIGGALIALLMSIDFLKDEGVSARGEFYSLYFMSTAGAVIFVQASELITLFLGLEIMSMALYCLCGSALHSEHSAESALKYFFLGSFSSAFLLYGIALLYGVTGTTVISDIAPLLSSADGPVLYLAVGLMLVGFVFKIGAVPFHFWAPDVYQGAPTPVTAYMACVIKASAVGAALRVLWVGFEMEAISLLWQGAVWMIALFTMLVGNLVALRQRSMKRMLAYSSVAHAGYLLVAFLAPGWEDGGGAAILYYLVVYTVMTLGAFGVVMAVTARFVGTEGHDDITKFNGLGRRNPFLAICMTLFLLSLAGLPPGLAGLVGKFYVFNAAVKAGFVGLAVAGVLCSAISVYYYLRVIVAMYFLPQDEELQDVAVPENPFMLSWMLRICACAVVLLGIFPSMIHDGAREVMRYF